MKKQLGIAVMLLGVVSLTAYAGVRFASLVRFDGAIGVDPVSNVVVNGTTTTVNSNIVRGISPSGQIWRIASLDANVTVDGHIRVHGRGLLLGGGNGIGTNGNQSVFATVFCGATVSNTDLAGVALETDGDFTIDDVLTPAPASPCTTPLLLIRTTAGARPWFAAGIKR
ncbi:MAG TPA: hypothetical protein VGF06_01925 [Terriglobales bacterium]